MLYYIVRESGSFASLLNTPILLYIRQAVSQLLYDIFRINGLSIFYFLNYLKISFFRIFIASENLT